MCLVEWILGRMGKKWESEGIKLFEECLVGSGREENDNGDHMFSLQAHQKVPTKMERTEWENLIGK